MLYALGGLVLIVAMLLIALIWYAAEAFRGLK
jgi:hypothetical protein